MAPKNMNPNARKAAKPKTKARVTLPVERHSTQVITFVGGKQPRFSVKSRQDPDPKATLPAAVRKVSNPVGLRMKLHLVQTAKKGMKVSEFRAVLKALPVEEKAWAELLSLPMSPKSGTLQQPAQRLSVLQSEQVYLVTAVFLRAMEVLEDRATALEWLTTPSDLFGNQAPIQMMRTSTGADLVLDQLGRMEHGVYS